jgi:hypothetical protein
METEKHSPKWLLNEIINSASHAHALFKIIEFQKALTEQCNIADFSQQRELLIEAFYLVNIHDGDKDKITKLVDLTLNTINGG